jgi:hypothetical protein
MAWIPDDAHPSTSGLSRDSYLVYSELCRWRDHSTGEASLPASTIESKLSGHITTESVEFCLIELERKGWIIRKAGRMFLIKGWAGDKGVEDGL